MEHQTFCVKLLDAFMICAFLRLYVADWTNNYFGLGLVVFHLRRNYGEPFGADWYLIFAYTNYMTWYMLAFAIWAAVDLMSLAVPFAFTHVMAIPIFENLHFFHMQRNIIRCIGGVGITLHGVIMGSLWFAYKVFDFITAKWKEEDDEYTVLGRPLKGPIWIWWYAQRAMDWLVFGSALQHSMESGSTLMEWAWSLILLLELLLLLCLFTLPLPQEQVRWLRWRHLMIGALLKDFLALMAQVVMFWACAKLWDKEYALIALLTRAMNVLNSLKKLLQPM